MSPRVLIVEDDRGLEQMLVDRLDSSGFETAVARSGSEALAVALGQTFDLVLLDIMLPEVDGLTVCTELRKQGVDTPILMLTALDTVVDRVVGLRLGADDYLTKPFDSLELMARIDALLRRSRHRSAEREVLEDPVRFGEVEVRFREMKLLRGGCEVHATAKMFQLLRVFVEHRGEVLSRDRLLDLAWGEDAMPAARTVDVHVAWLRQRIEAEPGRPRFLQTIRGAGYRFVADVTPRAPS